MPNYIEQTKLKFPEDYKFIDNGEGAIFSLDKKHRYMLYRIWDLKKPIAMFIGLNPSTANSHSDDNTIRSIKRICRNLDYGGFYMLNCFTYITSKPNDLIDFILFESEGDNSRNNQWLKHISKKCRDVIFCWGNFSIIKNTCRDKELIEMFPNAKALGINKNGSPQHPLYLPSNVRLINYKNSYE